MQNVDKSCHINREKTLNTGEKTLNTGKKIKSDELNNLTNTKYININILTIVLVSFLKSKNL